MRLVKLKDIPKKEEIQDCPTDNLIEILKIAQEMETLCLKENGIGISAVQVGIPLKMFLVRIDNLAAFDQMGFKCFVNLEYHPSDDFIINSLEGCLSIRSFDGQLRHFQVPRYKNVTLNGYLLDDNNNDLKLTSIQDLKLNLESQSIVFQHEIDHQNGITIDQIGKEVFLF